MITAQQFADTGKRAHAFVSGASPKLNKKSRRTTRRDIGTTSLSTAVGIIAAWGLHDGLGLEVPPEVAVAIGSVAGFFVARNFQY